MIVVVFRSRLNPGVEAEYGPRASEILELAKRQPGFVSFQGFSSDDGERVAIVEFETIEHVEAWAQHAEHRVAQQQGRDRFYAEYSLQICEPIRNSTFQRENRRDAD